MNQTITVKTTDDSIKELNLEVKESKLYIYVPNNIRLFDVVALSAALLSQHASQILQVKESSTKDYVDFNSSGVNMSLIEEIIFIVESEVNYVKDENILVIDMENSTFNFVPPVLGS